MKDKTTIIPSLKGFDGKKSSANSRTAQGKKTAERRLASQDTMKLEKIKSASVSGRKPSQSTTKRATNSRTTDTRRNTSSSAPGTYARERVSGSSDYDSSRRIDRSGQAQRRARMEANSKKIPSQTNKQRVSSYYDDIPQRTDAQRTGTGKPHTPPAKKRPTQSTDVRKSQRPKQQTAQKRRPAPKKTTPRPKKSLLPRNKKFRKAAGFTVLGLVLALVLFILSLTVFFKTKDFEVNGVDYPYNKKTIVKECGIYEGDNIFTANKSRAEDRIEENCAYVEEADVYSIFPNKIGIDLKMAKPACKINAMGGIHIVSDKGKVLDVVDNADDMDLPYIEGIQIKARDAGEFVDYGSDVLKRALEEMFKAFSSIEATKISEINIITKGDVFELRYVYDNRIVVYMGIPEEIGYKIQVADKIIDKLDAQEGTAVVGELDVSACHDEDAKSYFNPYSILGPDIAAPVTTTEEPVEEPTMTYEY